MNNPDKSGFVGYDCAIGRYGFIFYNPIDRSGAEDEAKALESGLNAVSCQVTKHKWTSQVQLDNLIDNEIKKAASGSLVIVCIMAHGGSGTLGCEEGEIFISDLLVQLAKPLPADLPMVRVAYIMFAPYALFRNELRSCRAQSSIRQCLLILSLTSSSERPHLCISSLTVWNHLLFGLPLSLIIFSSLLSTLMLSFFIFGLSSLYCECMSEHPQLNIALILPFL
jgi:hypothetical protein